MHKLSDAEIRNALAALPGWQYDARRGAIARSYVLADFNQAFGLMAQVALAAEKRNHHPEWSNVYNRVDIVWTTHDVGGLSTFDIDMAHWCDAAACRFSQEEKV
jgi:4a-hydroxytetrahydrobiopterin dehydratase